MSQELKVPESGSVELEEYLVKYLKGFSGIFAEGHGWLYKRPIVLMMLEGLVDLTRQPEN